MAKVKVKPIGKGYAAVRLGNSVEGLLKERAERIARAAEAMAGGGAEFTAQTIRLPGSSLKTGRVIAQVSTGNVEAMRAQSENRVLERALGSARD